MLSERLQPSGTPPDPFAAALAVGNNFDSTAQELPFNSTQPPPEISTGHDLSTFAAARGNGGIQHREIEYKKRPISPAHHSRHVEAAAFVPQLDELPETDQDLIGEVLEIALTAEKGEVTMTTAPGLFRRPESIIKPDDPIAVIADDLKMARLRAGTQYAKDGSSYSIAQREMRKLFEDIVDVSNTSNHYDEMTPAQANRILGELRSTAEYIDATLVDRVVTASNRVASFMESLPLDTLRKLYASRSDAESGSFKYLLKKNVDSDQVYVKSASARLLARIYGCDVLDLALNKENLGDTLVNKLVSDKRLVASPALLPEKSAEESQAEYDMKVRDYSEKLMRYLGISPETSVAYRKAMSERTMLKDENGRTIRGEGGGVDVIRLKGVLGNLQQTVDGVEPAKIDRVWRKCGITNFDVLSKQQLERMNDFAEGKSELLEHLRAGDITVVFMDGRGDHNGAVGGDAAAFEKESGRTLIFEINQPKDFIRYRNMLKKFNIKASVVVLGVHGSPGKMNYGVFEPGESGFLVTNADQRVLDEYTAADGIARYSVRQSKLIAGLTADIMQDSRGIDDDETLIGRRSILLLSCNQATEREIPESSEEGEQPVSESTAVSIVKSIGQEKVDLFAPPASAGLNKTYRGAYELHAKDVGKVPFIKHRLERGQLITEEKFELTLQRRSLREREKVAA